MADIIKPDLCVIGAGSLGIELATGARQRGLDVVLVRRDTAEAGDGPHASLQRAAFVASAARAQAMRSAGAVGLNNSEPKPNFRTIGEHAAAIADSVSARDSDERLTALVITVISGAPRFIDKSTLRCGDTTIRARQFALATGADPVIPALPGLDQVAFFTPDTIAGNLRKLSHLVVIGGESAAIELAQAYHRLGSKVTVVPQGGLLPGFDPELVAPLLRSLREEGLAILDDAEVTAIVPRSQGTGVTLQREAGEDSLDVSHILVAMGRRPDLDPALLEKADLRRERLRADHLLVGPDGQTSNGRISALGGAAGQFEPHLARLQAGLLLDRLTGRGKTRFDPQQAPRLLMTEPALAQIGLMGGKAPLRTGQRVLRANLAENDAARALGAPQGTGKLVVNAKGQLVGAALLGPGAGETIAMLALAMARGLPLAELARLALPQPSLAQLLVTLAEEFAAEQPRSGWTRRLTARR